MTRCSIQMLTYIFILMTKKNLHLTFDKHKGIPVFLLNKKKLNLKKGLTGGLVLSKAPMAILKPAPSAIRTFSFGILTSSKVMPLVSEHLWPMFISYRRKTNTRTCYYGGGRGGYVTASLNLLHTPKNSWGYQSFPSEL